jgi:hypothetical protein
MSDEPSIEEIERRFKAFNSPVSRDYIQFIKSEFEMKRKQSLYEKACNFAEKIIQIKTSTETEKKTQSAIKFCYLNISPSGPISLVTLLFLIFSPVFILFTLLGVLSLTTTLVSFIILGVISYYLYDYPFFKTRTIRARTSSELILTALYMAIALREVPSLENAIAFAAQNLSGTISQDLKRVIWEIYTRQNFTAQQALEEFTEKWRKENEEFSESIKLLTFSIQQSHDKALKMIDESMNLILSRTRERMDSYARSLQLPVMAIYALGILLPVITLVMFPIVMIFLQEFANVSILIIFYDIVLPIALFWFINTSLKVKPPTTSQPEIKGKLTDITIFNKSFSVLFITIPLIIIPTLLAGVSLFQYHTTFDTCKKWQVKNFNQTFIPEGFDMTKDSCQKLMSDMLTPTSYSSIITLAIALSIGISCFLITRNRMTVRENVKNLEREFSTALFQLGNQITLGNSLESALEKAKENLKNMEMANFYERILSNIKVLGTTLGDAIFNQKYGAIWKYPSELIKSVMKIVVESARKSLNAASVSMLAISTYLKEMHAVDEKIKESMSETVTSMKFLAAFLSPLVAGVTVAMAIIILNVVAMLSIQLSGLTTESGISVPTSASFLFGLWKGGASLSPDIFQLVLGIFIIESCVLLGIFINGIENGEDKIGELHLIGTFLIVSVLIYVIVLTIIYSLFGSLLGSLMFGVKV